MAVNVFTIAMVLLLLTLPSTVHSLTCKPSTKFVFCQNLPALHSQLRYTYNATNASLSIAFVATPSKPGGWISWSINPTDTGMVGAQAFVAYELNGTLLTKTLNIAGYKEFHPGNLSFPYWDVTAKKKNDTLTLYASLAVPRNQTVLNQVWQVGPGTDPDGKIQTHAFDAQNLLAKSTLSLTGDAATAPVPATSTTVAPPARKGKSKSGSLRRMKVTVSSGGFVPVQIWSLLMASLVTLHFL